jgi:NAD+ diphosphatase
MRADPILLGLDGIGRAVLAGDLEALAINAREALLEQGVLMPLREAGATLAAAESGLAAYLSSLVSWHRTHRFCPNCGWPTDRDEAGGSRHCPNCGAHHFPRTDPVVIMTVTHEDRLLLGRRNGSPEGRMSILAGFVAPGESAEEAVAREVREESGIEAFDASFVGSQPWPFPSSLMLGFDAWADGGEPRARDGELVEVRWVGLEEVRAAAREEGTGLRLPAPVSIARFLIDRWLAAREG